MASTRLGLVFVFALVFGFVSGYGQNWNEIFRQKKTQQKYLLQQIAALQVYTGYLKKGYEIVDGGLQTIKDLSDGEFSLHNAFISGLKQVSPAVRSDVRIMEIIEMQLVMGKAFGRLESRLAELSGLHQRYVRDVRENLWEESLKDLEELLLVITAGKVEMGDDQRMERLGRIYLSMRDKSAFAQHFINEVNLLARQKELDKRSIEQSRRSYGIN